MSTTEPMETSDPDKLVAEPLVSVLMITYNHEDYLAEAVHGVMAQECNFPYELVIGEDASTDRTLEVALACQKKYPDRIRIVHAEKNVGGLANSKRIFARARGKYVAYCEGDDFWCASDKLTRQVALIDGHPEIGIVHSDWTKAFPAGNGWEFDLAQSIHNRVPDRFLEGHIFATWHLPKILRTCTVLLRTKTVRDLYASSLGRGDYKFGDSVRSVFVMAQGSVAYVPCVTAVYRVSPNSALRSGARSRVAFYRSALQFDTDARHFFAGKANYPPDYRWESAAALLVWGIRAHDWQAVRDAVGDFRRHLSLWSFIRVGCRSVWLRVPSLRRQARARPAQPLTLGSRPRS